MRRTKNVLITGGAGFIGANFVHYWRDRYPDDHIIVLDALTYAGNIHNLDGLIDHNKIKFVQGNICDRSLVDRILTTENIEAIAHFAAESHVDRSILAPDAFIQTNIVGTFTLLEAFKQHFQTLEKGLFLHVSTDEVYGSLAREDPAFTESTGYDPNSPYSASKAGSDHLVRAYFHTYKIPTIITNCSNNYGAYQFPEKLIPLMCINMLLGKPLPIYGDGENIRDWLYVQDHCSALDVVIHHGTAGETYNIGGNNEVKNIDLVKILCQLMNELAPNLPIKPTEQLITFVKDRPGHDRRYAINSNKLQTQLKWTPSVTVEQGLKQTVQWYLNNENWWQPLLSKEYQDYYQKIYN
jgi:dTDP-glucose 4,6-dehydratase